MKRIIILLLALMPIVASAQEYIDKDESNENGRLVVTKSTPIISDGKMYFMRFVYSLFEENEIYYTTIVCCDEEYRWNVSPHTTGVFRMATGKNIYLKTLIDSESKLLPDGEYMIFTSYIIPTEKVYDMLDALKTISIKTSSHFFDIKIDFESASTLMKSYLDLLVTTGR